MWRRHEQDEPHRHLLHTASSTEEIEMSIALTQEKLDPFPERILHDQGLAYRATLIAMSYFRITVGKYSGTHAIHTFGTERMGSMQILRFQGGGVPHKFSLFIGGAGHPVPPFQTGALSLDATTCASKRKVRFIFALSCQQSTVSNQTSPFLFPKASQIQYPVIE